MFHTEIQIKGKLSSSWSDWFQGLQIRATGSGDTILYGDLPDKSAVYGILSRLSSLGISLISLSCKEESDTGPPDK